MIHDDFRVIGAHDTVLDCADLFSLTLRNDNISGIRYKMGLSSFVVVKNFIR